MGATLVPMPGLADHQWKRRFSSSLESLLEGFYRPALMDATRYWRITGYFTSRSLLQVLEGVERLVAASADGIGRGQMRLITGVFLIVGVAVMMINLIVDLSYGLLDPKVRYR